MADVRDRIGEAHFHDMQRKRRVARRESAHDLRARVAAVVGEDDDLEPGGVEARAVEVALTGERAQRTGQATCLVADGNDHRDAQGGTRGWQRAPVGAAAGARKSHGGRTANFRPARRGTPLAQVVR